MLRKSDKKGYCKPEKDRDSAIKALNRMPVLEN